MEMDLLINPNIWMNYSAAVINSVLYILIYWKRRNIANQDQGNQSNLNPQPEAYNNQVPRNLGSFLTKCLGLIMMALATLANNILKWLVSTYSTRTINRHSYYSRILILGSRLLHKKRTKMRFSLKS